MLTSDTEAGSKERIAISNENKRDEQERSYDPLRIRMERGPEVGLEQRNTLLAEEFCIMEKEKVWKRLLFDRDVQQ